MLATNRWKEDLERLLAASQDRSPTERINSIRDLGLAMGHEAGEALLQAHPELFAHQPALTEAFRRMILAQDIAEVAQLMKQEVAGRVSFKDVASNKTNIGVLSSTEAYDRLSEIFDHVDFRGCRRAVMVGCGGRPFTMFRLHDMTAVPEIIGLDIVPEAVDMANALTAKLGYDRMHAELCDGLDYDYRGAEIVYVASMVTPKAAVVSRIVDTAPEPVTIILWEPYSLGRLWAEAAEPTLDPRLEVTGRSSVWRNMTRDVFARRRGAPSSRRTGG
jgi:hypothetical protein